MATTIRVSGGLRLAWSAEGIEGDDGPIAAIARSDDFPGLDPRGERESEEDRWAAARWHVDRWIARPEGIDAILKRQVPPPGPSIGRPLVSSIRMPDSLARILAAHGVDPRAFAAVAACRVGRWDVTIDGSPCEVHVDRMGDHLRVTGLIQATGVIMVDTEAGHLALGDMLPQSATAALIGRTTADAVDLPMLRGLELEVTGVDEWVGSVLHYRDEDVAVGDMAVERED